MVKAILLILHLIPYKWALRVGSFIGELAFLLRIRYDVSMRNLSLMLNGEGDGKFCRRIILESYRNFGRSLVEFALLPRLKPHLKELVRIDDKQIFDEALSTGAVLVTAHYGSWELFGAALKAYGYPIEFLVGQQTNNLVDNLMNKIRSEMGIGLIRMGISAKGVIKALKEKKYVAMLSDQDAGDSGVIVQFFGKPASTPKGAAAFALKASVPILTGAIIRDENGITHTVKTIRIEPDRFIGFDDPVKALTQEYTSILEQIIMEKPEGWFWAHRRFKTTIKGFYR